MLVQYGTVIDHVVTVPEFISLDLIVTVYVFNIGLNWAVYVASAVAATGVGLQFQLNVYVYCAVAVFVGVGQVYVGTSL
jgi:hypothetical protein